MTEKWYQRENRFFVEDAWIDFEDMDEDDPEINAVVIDLVNSTDKLYLYPRKEVTREGKVNGLPGKSTEEVNYRTDDLPKKFSKLVRTTPDVADGQVIVIDGTCQVTEYDDGNKAYRMYNDMLKGDSFNMEAVEYTEVHQNPKDMSEERQKKLSEEKLDKGKSSSESGESAEESPPES